MTIHDKRCLHTPKNARPPCVRCRQRAGVRETIQAGAEGFGYQLFAKAHVDTLTDDGAGAGKDGYYSIAVVPDELESGSLAFFLRFPPHVQCERELLEELPSGACKWDAQAEAWLIDGDYIQKADSIAQRYFRTTATMSARPSDPWKALGVRPDSSLWAARSARNRIYELYGDDLQHCKTAELALEKIEWLYSGG